MLLAVIGLVVRNGLVEAPRTPITTLAVSEVAFATAETIPVTGWTSDPRTLRNIDAEAQRRGIRPPTAWVRYRFDRAAVGDGKLALSSAFMRERYTIFLNGVDIYRTDTSAVDASFIWRRPVAVPLPEFVLTSGVNTLVFRLESARSRPLSIGAVGIGDDKAVRARAGRLMMLTTTAPAVIDGVLVILSLGTMMFWLVRPQESVFGWLAMLGLVWGFRNLQYFLDRAPFDNALFWNLTTDSVFVMVMVAYGFAATFMMLPNRRRVIGIVVAVCLLGIIVRHSLVVFGLSDIPSFVLTIPMAIAILQVFAAACLRERRIENFVMLGAVTIATAFGWHDLSMAANYGRTLGFFLLPFGSLLVFSAFGFALGRRMLLALAENEDSNLLLEQRVAEVTASLNESEAHRRALQIANAVENERERMMREIHDGIGSSLITALAVAERRQESPATIATLKRSITDLRIGVDSLEPIDGDIAMLLASLRHRMERELQAAGLAFAWKVESVPVMPWLDAVAALHVLRILQEAIGNIVAHAGATLIEVGCRRDSRGGADGVLITIADNGCGFDPASARGGRGVSNMHARAEALNAELVCKSGVGGGTTVSLWLPNRAS
jgi:signal transduction histidine kinase